MSGMDERSVWYDRFSEKSLAMGYWSNKTKRFSSPTHHLPTGIVVAVRFRKIASLQQNIQNSFPRRGWWRHVSLTKPDGKTSANPSTTWDLIKDLTVGSKRRRQNSGPRLFLERSRQLKLPVHHYWLFHSAMSTKKRWLKLLVSKCQLSHCDQSFGWWLQ